MSPSQKIKITRFKRLKNLDVYLELGRHFEFS
jgi:hypothetical protein